MIKRLRSLGKNDAAIVFLPLTGGNPDSVDWSRYIDNQGRQSSCVTYFASYLERALQERVCLYHSKMDMDNDGDQQENAAENIDAFGDLRGREGVGRSRSILSSEDAESWSPRRVSEWV